MAKAKKRIFELAKELDVNSKAILEKLQSEGLEEYDNHMKAVPLGLEMTIREWFSGDGESAASASDDEAESTASKPAPRQRAKTDQSDDDDQSGGTAVAVERKRPTAPARAKAKAKARAKPKAKPEATEKPAAKATKAKPAETRDESAASGESTEAVSDSAAPSEAAAESTETPAAEEKTSTAEAEEQSTEAAPPAAAASDQSDQDAAAEAGPSEQEQPETPESEQAGPRAVPNVPERPEEIKPAGPQLDRPTAAKLKGPKVVRVEQPDVVRTPRRRPGGPGGGGGPEDITRSRGPARGQGVGKPGGPAEDSRSPRRRRSSRRGRSADAEMIGRGQFSEQDLAEREERMSRAGGFIRSRRRNVRNRATATGPAESLVETGGKVEIAEPISIKDLSAATGIKGAEIVAFLFNKGIMATINQTIDSETAQEVCLEYDIELVVKEAKTAEEAVEHELEAREMVDERPRPPVVAVLGHVDHGKTSLLDKIRKQDVAAGEAGGITQHIGAYRATIQGTDGEDKTVVFLDTPGHEAFTAMRLRGANLTDVVVIVIAADDGMMPQTIESINHAKAAGVRVVVALNKIDRPEVNDEKIQRILGQLAEQGLNPVEWGGETEVVRTSAETGEGITELMEILDFQAELLELTADYGGMGYGQVIEAELSEGRGPVARVLVRGGTVSVGDFVVMGRAFGRVRDIIDDRGNNLESAGPATPVEISGIDEVPDAGDKCYITKTLKQAEDIATQRRDAERKRELAQKSKVTLDNFFEQTQAADVKELRVVIKADVQGSVEVLRKTLSELGEDNEEVSVRVLHAAVGGITESDVLLAEASDAVIVGFQVIASQRARSEAERRGVDVRLYRVIYDLVEDVHKALEGMLAPERREEVLGHAEVREAFRVSKVGMVAGCYVTDGVVRRNARIRVTRDDIVIEHDRVLSSLKRFKDDAREVRAGMECGMSIEGYDDVQPGDVLECYVTTEVAQTL